MIFLIIQLRKTNKIRLQEVFVIIHIPRTHVYISADSIEFFKPTILDVEVLNTSIRSMPFSHITYLVVKWMMDHQLNLWLTYSQISRGVILFSTPQVVPPVFVLPNTAHRTVTVSISIV